MNRRQRCKSWRPICCSSHRIIASVKSSQSNESSLQTPAVGIVGSAFQSLDFHDAATDPRLSEVKIGNRRKEFNPNRFVTESD